MKLCNIPCNTSASFCDTCVVVKMHQLPYFASAIVYNKPLELVFMDIWDPFSKNAMNSSKRCLAFLDDFPKFT